MFLALRTRTAPKRARNRVDAAATLINYRRAKPRAERQRGSRGHCCQGAGAAIQSHLAAPRDAARLHQTPP